MQTTLLKNTKSSSQILSKFWSLLISGQTVTVYCEKENREQLRDIFEEVGIDQYSIELQNKEIELQERVHQLIEWPISKNDLYQYYQKKGIEKLIESFNRNVFGNERWKDIAMKSIQFVNRNSQLHLPLSIDTSQFDFDKKEYWYLKGRLSRMLDLADKKPLISDQNWIFSKEFFINHAVDDNADQIYDQLEGYYSSVQKLINRYHIAFEVDKVEKTKLFYEKVNQLHSALEGFSIEWHDTVFHSEEFDKESLFKKNKQKQIRLNQFNAIIDKVNFLSVFPYIERQEEANSLEIFQTIDQCKGLVNNANQYLPLYLKRQVQNAEFAQHISMEQIQPVLDKLNDDQIFRSHFECNAISQLSRYEYLLEVKNDISLAINQLSSAVHSFSYLHFVYQLEERYQTFIRSFEDLPKKRALLEFNKLYIQMLETCHRDPQLENFDEMLSNWMDSVEIENLMVPGTNQDRMIEHVDILHSFKKKYPFTFKKIQNGSPLDTQEDVMIQKEMIDQLFPVQIVESKDNHTDFSAKALISEFQKETTQEEPIMVNPKSLSTLTLKEKLNYTNFLVEGMSTLFPQLMIFTDTDSVYLFHCHDLYVQKLLEQLQDKRVKQIHPGENIKEKLIEVLLLDSERIYLIYDDFLPFDKERYLEEYVLFSFLMEKSGIQINRINTLDYVTKGSLQGNLFQENN